ncbi:MAG: nitrous oxide reductase family maturation protein NosD [Motiliproteus sp.]
MISSQTQTTTRPLRQGFAGQVTAYVTGYACTNRITPTSNTTTTLTARSALLCGLFFGIVTPATQAAVFSVSGTQADAGTTLQDTINQAQSGDQIIIEAGRYHGNFIIDKALTLTGKPGAILDGNGINNTLTLAHADSRIEGLRIENWGDDLTDLNAGVFINKNASNAVVRNNYFKGTTSGLWVDATQGIRILNNRIEGDLSTRSQDRGNGIHLFNVGGALVKDNEIWHTRDGIYIDTSNDNELNHNYLHDLRYGVHYMYSHRNKVIYNFTHNTRTGYALMQSKYLTVEGNRSEDDQNYGVLMNFITNSTINGNVVTGVQTGRNPHLQQNSHAIGGAEGKALFMYNSMFNRITDNLFNASDLGIHMTAGSEDNVIAGNAFTDNKEQVKYVSNRKQNWSENGRGNFWSDYLGWDMDDDGIGDTHYEPNDGVDKLLWKYPSVKVLLNSPAVETLRWVQRQFPVLKSPGVFDSSPLITSPFTEAETQAAAFKPEEVSQR